MKKLFFSSFAVNILVMALNMGTGIVMARFLGPYGRGELAMATRWAVLFAGLSTLGLPGAMIYLGKNFKEKQREIFGAFLVTGALVGLSALVICLLLTYVIMSGESREMILLGQLALLALPFAVMTDGLIGTLQSFNSFRKVLLTRILNPAGTLVALILLILTGNVTVFNIILLNVIWGAATFFLIIYWIFKVMKPKFTKLYTNAKMLLQYGVKIYASSLVQVFGGSFDQILLSLTLSAYALGIYTVASSIGSILPSILYGALNVFLAPRLMDFAGERRRQEVSRIHAIFFYGTAVAAVCGCLVLPFVIPFMYGQEFSEAVLLGIILLLTSPVKIGYSILLNFFAAEGKFNVLSKTEIIGLVTGFGALLILVRFTGAAGAAWALGAANLAKWGYLIVQAKKLKVPVAGLFRLQPGEVLALLRGFSLKKRRSFT